MLQLIELIVDNYQTICISLAFGFILGLAQK